MSPASNISRTRSILGRVRASAAFAVAVCAAASALAMTIVDSAAARSATHRPRWSAEERTTLRSLSLASLPALPRDPSNRYADDARAAALGKDLFFDARLSGNGKVSCASCHVPARGFQDDKALGEGVGTTARRTMPIAGTAYSPWFFWDGRADSQWEQALGPLESAVEHGGNRTLYAHVIAERYRSRYGAVFGPMPDLDGLPRNAGPAADSVRRAAWGRIPSTRQDEITRVYANIGKAIAAYERRVAFTPTRFDRYVDAELAGRAHTAGDALSDDEESGLRLFIGKANCTRCHNGARLTDDHFHNTGIPLPITPLPADSGRLVGIRKATQGEFACTGRYSDAKPDDCEELRFADTEGEQLVRAYKTPSLRGVASRAPYMHAGQLRTLGEVIAHYDRAPAPPFGKTELVPLHLSPRERAQLEAFLRTLDSAPVAP